MRIFFVIRFLKLLFFETVSFVCRMQKNPTQPFAFSSLNFLIFVPNLQKSAIRLVNVKKLKTSFALSSLNFLIFSCKLRKVSKKCHSFDECQKIWQIYVRTDKFIFFNIQSFCSFLVFVLKNKKTNVDQNNYFCFVWHKTFFYVFFRGFCQNAVLHIDGKYSQNKIKKYLWRNID